MPPPDPLVPVERLIQSGLARLPPVVSRWLGYRGKSLPPSVTWVVCLWGFVGAFAGLSVVLAVFGHTEYFRSRAVPPIVASFVSLRLYIQIHVLIGLGRFCYTLLWSNRCTASPASLSRLRPLL